MAISREYILLSVVLIVIVMIASLYTVRGTNRDVERADTKTIEVYGKFFKISQPLQNYMVTDMPDAGDIAIIPFKIQVTKIPPEIVVQVENPDYWGIEDVYIKDPVTGQFGTIEPKLEGVSNATIGDGVVSYATRAVIDTSKVINGTTIEFYLKLVQFKTHDVDDTIKLRVDIGGASETIMIRTQLLDKNTISG